MKILRLDLARFRHFTGRTLELAPVAEPEAGTLALFPETKGRLCLIQGDNEAGKTTVLEAIRCLLFGFHDRSAHLALEGDQSALEVGALVEFSGGKGSRVEVRRRKGRKQTLHGRMVQGGDEVDDAWFNDRMSRPNKALFDAVFGFSLDTLARGAESLRAKEVVGSIYGAGFGGAVQPQEILADLQRARAELFKDGGKTPSINAAKARLDDLRKSIGAVSGSNAELQRLDDELRHRSADADARSQEAKDLRAEIDRRRALLAGLPAYRAREAAKEELATLEIPRFFPDGGAAAFDRLVEARDRLLQDQAHQRELLSLASTEVDALVVDATLLERSEAIEASYRGLDAQRQALDEAPGCERALAELRRTTAARLHELRPTWDLDTLRVARFDAAARADFESSLAAVAKLAADTSAADALVSKLEDALAAIDEQLVALPPATDARRARAWLEQCSGVLAERKSLDQLDREIATLDRKRVALRRKLDPPFTSSDVDVTQLVVPRVEEIDRFAASFASIDERLGQLDVQQRAHETELARLEGELAAIEAGGHAPSQTELEAARAHREKGWRLVLRALEGERSDGALAKNVVAFAGDGRPLARAFEHAVNLADGVADAMRIRADAVQKRALCEARRSGFMHELETTKEKRAALDITRAREETSWRKAWEPCGLTPLPPATMRAWLSDHAALLEHAAHLDDLRDRRAQLSAKQREFLDEARLALTVGGLELPLDVTLERARSEAQRLVETESDREKRRATLVSQRDHDVPRLAAARDSVRALRLDADRFLARWSSVTHALGIEGSLSVDAARKLVPDLLELHRSFVREEARLQARQVALAAELQRHRDAVRVLDATVDDSLAALDAVARLHRELQEARASLRARNEGRKRIAAATALLANIDQTLEATCEELARLRSLAAAPDDASFSRAAERVARAADLHAMIAESDRTLLHQRGPWSTADYEAELQRASEGDLRVDLERLAVQADERVAALRALEQEVGALRTQRETLDGNAAAAEAMSAAESERASLREDIERYAVLSVAEALLGGAIKRFEDEHQPELLTSASGIFGAMTLGRYARVQRKIADGSLFVERNDGKELGPEQLSTGTREQLYLAIRLAYVEHYRRSAEPLPVVLDDVLVNFDDARALATLRALATFAQTTQVLLFTCHAHLVALVEGAQLEVTHLTI